MFKATPEGRSSAVDADDWPVEVAPQSGRQESGVGAFERGAAFLARLTRIAVSDVLGKHAANIQTKGIAMDLLLLIIIVLLVLSLAGGAFISPLVLLLLIVVAVLLLGPYRGRRGRL
jgi:hypothetical protein